MTSIYAPFVKACARVVASTDAESAHEDGYNDAWNGRQKSDKYEGNLKEHYDRGYDDGVYDRRREGRKHDDSQTGR